MFCPPPTAYAPATDCAEEGSPMMECSGIVTRVQGNLSKADLQPNGESRYPSHTPMGARRTYR